MAFRIGKQEVRIAEEYLFLNKKRINWQDIVGIRKFTSYWLYQFGSTMPIAELFLRGGKVSRLYSYLILKDAEPISFNDKYKNRFSHFFTVLDITSKKATNVRNEISSWFEWRLMIPSIIAEVVVTVVGIYRGLSITDFIDFAIVGGVIGFPIGFIWERKARKAKWQ